MVAFETNYRLGVEMKVSRRFTVEVNEMLDPFCRQPNFRYVEALAYIVRRGMAEFRGEYGSTTPIDYLDGKPSCVNGSGPLILTGAQWFKSVVRAFEYAVLCRCRSPHIEAWREALNLRYGGTLVIPGSTVRPWSQRDGDNRQPGCAEMTSQLTRLLASSGQLAWQLNEFHPKAVWIQNVCLRLGGGADVCVYYGYKNDSSRWGYVLAEQQKGEPLLLTVQRATAVLTGLVDRDAEPPTLWNDKKARRAGRQKPHVTNR